MSTTISKEAADTSKSAQVAELERQSRRLAELTLRRTRVQVTLENARKELETLRAAAIAEFHTADLEELRALFRREHEANQQVIVEFTEQLDKVERVLGDIERQIKA